MQSKIERQRERKRETKRETLVDIPRQFKRGLETERQSKRDRV